MNNKITIAVDVGGSGGKIVAATYDNKRIKVLKTIKFSNSIKSNKEGNLVTIDALDLINRIKKGICDLSKIGEIESIGIDTRGGSYGYVYSNGKNVDKIITERGTRTLKSYPETCKIMSELEVFLQTGGKNDPSCVLSQLHYDLLFNTKQLSKAKSILFMPSILSFLLTGTISCECTTASVTCLTDAAGMSWNKKIIEKFNLPQRIFPPLVSTGSFNGFVKKPFSKEIGSHTKVFNTAGHDTATALGILPNMQTNDFFISVGTTIVVGAISSEPFIAEKTFNYRYRNSASPFGNNLLRRNITGFWIVDEIRRELESNGQKLSFNDLINLAEKEKNNKSFVDINKKIFKGTNTSKIAAIKSECEKCGQKIPEDLGSLIRCLYESYAMRIKYSLECLKDIVSIPGFNRIFVINGGVRNSLLMKMIANALGQEILIGIPWASLGGNLVIQMCSTGLIAEDDIDIIRSNSFKFEKIQPDDTIKKWQENYSSIIGSDLYS